MVTFLGIVVIYLMASALVFALGVASVLWSGYVLSIVWGWFMVPLFSLPALDIPQAVAVCIVAYFLTHQYSKSEEDLASAVLYAALRPASFLLMAWIVRFWW